MHIQEIRNQALFEEIDSIFLKDALKTYKQPRNKIRSLLERKDLVRIKKGLYIFGPRVARIPYCKELLANLIYGPSAISLEYALSFYGLIPERVETLTSITSHRTRSYDTPLGQFSYQHLPMCYYFFGITRLEFPNNHFVLFATPEKALSDYLVLKSPYLRSLKSLEIFLFDNMRIEETYFFKLNKEIISEISEHYQHQNTTLLAKYIRGEHDASRH